MFIGVLAEISMKAKLLNLRLGREPDCVGDVIWEIEKLEGELIDAVCEFDDDGDT